ncbi:peptidase S08 family protein [Kitasatospora sp. MMS16-BH015]|uniref:S8 family serine peptidase n=1 Tax=Kitasatospora sp. MMS16-BH015 TaxID=2018025 RepID=UPI000CA3B55F|nr:S8 family serine peptidase [Kitasatospora sp. MMS16-BH015]AUG79915.1 peptidase S08 family protein [Kitasatospora sp. MMS16-BH015]
MHRLYPTEGPADRSGPRVPVRALLVMLLIALLLGGAVPYVSGPGRAYLSYLVLADRSDPAGAALAADGARTADGRVVQEYPQIGAVLAYATGGFAARLRGRPGIAAVGATRTAPVASLPGPLDGAGDFHRTVAAVPGPASAAVSGAGSIDGGWLGGALSGGGRLGGGRPGGGWLGGGEASLPDPDEGTDWNLAMVGAVEPAGGGPLVRSPATDRAGVTGQALRRVTVAVLDSGVDDTHPDLRGAVDPAASASCADGRPDARSGAWRPDQGVNESGHGTHVAGIVGAVRDGKGVSGVAPGVRIAAVRLLGPLGQYYAENIVCGLLWAADHGARAVNDSYFADPWKYNCPEDADQAALIQAVGRAVAYAQRQGAVVVASAGNDAQDLGAARTDHRSPNDRLTGPAQDRRLGTECIRLPGELPGVVTVGAVDRSGLPAAYTNYGVGRITLAAPGGDPDGGVQGAIVSDWPGGQYVALAGTSMAAAHVTGAVAVAAAEHPDWRPEQLTALLTGLAAAHCPFGPGACVDNRYFGAGVLTLPR